MKSKGNCVVWPFPQESLSGLRFNLKLLSPTRQTNFRKLKYNADNLFGRLSLTNLETDEGKSVKQRFIFKVTVINIPFLIKNNVFITL